MPFKLCTVFSWKATSTSRPSASGMSNSRGSSGNGYHRKTSEVSKWPQYILTVIDYFTKWAEAYPIRYCKATTVAIVLVENWLTRLAMPKEIISDQGTEFVGEQFTELCKFLNMSTQDQPIQAVDKWNGGKVPLNIESKVGESRQRNSA